MKLLKPNVRTRIFFDVVRWDLFDYWAKIVSVKFKLL